MNSKHTKRALLSSFWALLLCFAMLLGTTFAWFTDTASTSVNKIQAGNLKIDLGVFNDDGNWVSKKGETLTWQKAKGAEDEDILWEPGCTYYLEEVAIRNTGNLALKYKVDVTGIKGDAKLNEAIEWSVVVDDFSTDYADAVSGTVINTEHTMLPDEYHVLRISGHMKEEADNTYQGLSIDGVGITVYATQWTYESDSFGNDYDAGATLPSIAASDLTPEAPADTTASEIHITSAAEFAWLMEQTNKGINSQYADKTFVLDCDIDFGGAAITGVGSEQDNIVFTFDGNGHTISNFTITRTSSYYAGLFQQFNGTVKNLTVANATIKGNAMVGAIASNVDNGGKIENCEVYDCTLIGTKKIGAVVGYIAGENCSVTGCYAEDCTVIYSEKEAGEITGYQGDGCTFSDNNYKNVTVSKAVSSFDDFDAAIKDADCHHITLNADITNSKQTLQNEFCYTLSENRDLTIDLGGKTLNTTVKLFKVEKGTTLTLTSSVAGGKVYCNSNLGGNRFILLVDDGGTLNIENNVTIEAKKFGEFGENDPIAGAIYCEGTLNMKGGEIIVHDTVAVNLWASQGGAKFNMTGGKITIAADVADYASMAIGVTEFGQNVSYDVNLTSGEISGKGWAVMDAFGGNVAYNEETGFVMNVTAVNFSQE